MHGVDYLLIAVYLLATVGIGYFVGRRQKGTEDYFLGGRGMKWWPVAISLFASLFSSISYIGVPAEAFNFGCTMLLCGLASVIALPVMLFVFLKFFYNMKIWTVNEYLENRFDVRIRCVASTLYLISKMVYLGIMLYATSILLEGAFGWPPWVSVLIVGGFTTLYTCLGGLEGAIWTEVIQFVVMLGGVLMIIFFVAFKMPGGLGGIWDFAVAQGRGFKAGLDSGVWDFKFNQRISFWMVLISVIPGFITPAVQQSNLQRCMTCKNFRDVARAISSATLGNLPIMFLFYFAGLAIFSYFRFLHPEILPLDVRGDKAFTYFVSNVLPIGFRGLLIAGLLAAVMSSVDAMINSICAVFIKDLYQKMMFKGRSEQHYMLVSKVSTVLIGLISMLFGLAILYLFSAKDIHIGEVSEVSLAICSCFSIGIFVSALLTYRINGTGLIVSLVLCIPSVLYVAVVYYLMRDKDHRIGLKFLTTLPIFLVIFVAYIASLFCGRNKNDSARYVIWDRWRKCGSKEEISK